MNIVDYVADHTTRGECDCGQCIDRGNRPDPTHSVDTGFLKVGMRHTPDLSTFLRLSQDWQGAFTDTDPFDGNEHSYIELGGWLGDQGIALRYMALGHMLEAFNLLTPRALLGDAIDEATARQMAGMGLVTIKAKAPP